MTGHRLNCLVPRLWWCGFKTIINSVDGRRHRLLRVRQCWQTLDSVREVLMAAQQVKSSSRPSNSWLNGLCSFFLLLLQVLSVVEQPLVEFEHPGVRHMTVGKELHNNYNSRPRSRSVREPSDVVCVRSVQRGDNGGLTGHGGFGHVTDSGYRTCSILGLTYTVVDALFWLLFGTATSPGVEWQWIWTLTVGTRCGFFIWTPIPICQLGHGVTAWNKQVKIKKQVVTGLQIQNDENLFIE